jgi:hypothetical protein
MKAKAKLFSIFVYTVRNVGQSDYSFYTNLHQSNGHCEFFNDKSNFTIFKVENTITSGDSLLYWCAPASSAFNSCRQCMMFVIFERS